jgi:hypothetical protein
MMICSSSSHGRLKVCCLLLLFSTLSNGVSAWGTEGHEIVANLAWRRLTDQTRQAVTDVLGSSVVNGTAEAGSPLAAVADWADRVRHYKPWSAPLHYIDIQDEDIEGGCHAAKLDPRCTFTYERDCLNDVCVAGAIVNYTSQLMTMDDYAYEKEDSSSSDDSSLRRNNDNPLMDSSAAKKEALMFLTQ